MAAADLELCYMTGTEAISAFKAKKPSPVELMKAVIVRCEAVNPKLNDITYNFYDGALAVARRAEKQYVKKGGHCPKLASWYDAFSQRPSLAATVPKA